MKIKVSVVGTPYENAELLAGTLALGLLVPVFCSLQEGMAMTIDIPIYPKRGITRERVLKEVRSLGIAAEEIAENTA